MSSIIKVDTIQDQDGNNIINENANTITIGASGDTITVPSGATLDTSNSTVTLPDGSVSLAKLSATGTKDATTFLRGDDTFNGVASLSTASGSAPSYSARAWVNFNGTGTVAIREDGNVSSITDNGTGNYTVNFTTAMPDANYSAIASASFNDTISFGFSVRDIIVNNTATGSVRILTPNSSGTATDFLNVFVAIFR